MIRQWFQSGVPWVWLNAAAVSISLILVFGLLGLIAVKGLGHFWPSPVAAIDYQDKAGSESVLIGEIVRSQALSPERTKDAGYTVLPGAKQVTQDLIKTGNRDLTGRDFRWISTDAVKGLNYDEDLLVVERREWGNLYGYLVSFKIEGEVISEGEKAWRDVTKSLHRTLQLFDAIRDLEKHRIGAVNYGLERLRLKSKSLEIKGKLDAPAKQEIAEKKAGYEAEYQQLKAKLLVSYKKISTDSIVVRVAGGKRLEVPMAKVVDIYQPNAMNLWQKMGFYIAKVWEFLSDEPREANTEGGVFPAIFGTVMMVMIMAVIVTPFGVIAAVYLREYAKQGIITRIIRIAVNNLAGVPSIVYGVFGLGFFVYFLGGNIDALFFPEASPSPVFGTPGILWASLTLALLTLPVVIVSTEEGLSRIPKSIREGSLALGATKAETLRLTVLPMASPAMMTGLILAVARAAGEVAPLMLVGVVKLAPSLPVDGNFPFLHLDRKFMHLGFHIYDVGFQSPNVEAARPLVYSTALLLVLVIIGLNLAAVAVRNNLREKYRALEN